jgi:perosamine synthetase
MGLPLLYSKQQISDADIQAVKEVLCSDFLTTGPQVTAFEEMLCAATRARYAIASSSGTTALHLACLALDIKKGDKGITSPITFLASANCMEFCGGKVDFVDIDASTLCLSPEQLEKYCRNGQPPAVVIPVDFAGIPADLPAIQVLSQKYGFKIIEDAAHSLGSTYSYQGKEYPCGCCQHSDLAILSFHPVKTITTGEGGAVLTNDDKLAEALRRLRSHGTVKGGKQNSPLDGDWYYQMLSLGYNYRITDIQCALGLSQLKRLAEFKARRQSIVKCYNEFFQKNSEFIIPPWPSNTSPCQHLYPLQIGAGPKKRKLLYDSLKQDRIFTQVHYIPVYWQPYYSQKYGYRQGKCPEAELYYSRCLSLPLYPTMADDDCELVESSIKKYMGKK